MRQWTESDIEIRELARSIRDWRRVPNTCSDSLSVMISEIVSVRRCAPRWRVVLRARQLSLGILRSLCVAYSDAQEETIVSGSNEISITREQTSDRFASEFDKHALRMAFLIVARAN